MEKDKGMYQSDKHDYDPSWDYELDDEPLDEVKRLVDRFVEAHDPIFRALKMTVPHVFYVTGLDEGKHLAKFVSGTASDPFIVLDSRYLDEQADKFNAALEDAVESTLLHEYGHAYLEATGEHDEMSEHQEERLVEKFAKTYWKTRDPKKAVKVLSRR